MKTFDFLSTTPNFAREVGIWVCRAFVIHVAIWYYEMQCIAIQGD